ncbi:MAG: HAD family hydrolase [Magnetococcales bacterium]|nr:HAD family hydrolase [Magnetococcales bacterium]
MFALFAFDFDGVLADSVPLKDEALLHLLRDHGPEVQERAMAVWNRTRGVFRPQRIKQVFQEAAGIALSEAEVAARVDEFVHQVVERTVATRPIPGSVEFVQRCRIQGPCFVVSAGPQDEVRSVVTRRGIASLFKGIYGGPEKKAVVLNKILQEHATDPARGLFVGDSDADHLAAVAVGMAFLGLVPPGQPNPFPAGVPVVPDLTHPLPPGLA